MVLMTRGEEEGGGHDQGKEGGDLDQGEEGGVHDLFSITQ